MAKHIPNNNILTSCFRSVANQRLASASGNWGAGSFEPQDFIKKAKRLISKVTDSDDPAFYYKDSDKEDLRLVFLEVAPALVLNDPAFQRSSEDLIIKKRDALWKAAEDSGLIKSERSALGW